MKRYYPIIATSLVFLAAFALAYWYYFVPPKMRVIERGQYRIRVQFGREIHEITSFMDSPTILPAPMGKPYYIEVHYYYVPSLDRNQYDVALYKKDGTLLQEIEDIQQGETFIG